MTLEQRQSGEGAACRLQTEVFLDTKCPRKHGGFDNYPPTTLNNVLALD